MDLMNIFVNVIIRSENTSLSFVQYLPKFVTVSTVIIWYWLR